MCGVVGFIGGLAAANRESAVPILRRMADQIVTRGPDSGGYWFDADNQIGFGHRRLAIVDLSPAGHQPMESPSSRYVVVFNGEIYNHRELREQLESCGISAKWRGQSDTETLLVCLESWGLDRTIRACNGMFAIAIWDRELKQLILVRDRLGEKPLYYGWCGSGTGATFIFSSELKALRAHPAFRAVIDRDALSLLLRHNCIPAPYSIYEGVKKLEPGTILTISLEAREPGLRTYWSMEEVVAAGRAYPFAGRETDAVEQLEVLLRGAIKRQMVADVPLGAFLSGGIDSTTVVALMQAQSNRPVRTFTIGFNEEGYNEAAHAKSVAAYLGTEHTELYVPAGQALEVVPKLAHIYCEPFSDSSQIPTFLVSALARQHVTVALSGDAGDELFAGYNRYVLTKKLWSGISCLPSGLRRVIKEGITAVSPGAWAGALGPLQRMLPITRRVNNIGDKLHKGAEVLAVRSQDELYRRLVSHWTCPDDVIVGANEPTTRLTSGVFDALSGVERMMALDAISYLPDDILVKVDRAAMSVSLETRVPMLDHEIVEFAWRLPLQYKLRGSTSKWILRQVLYRHVPKHLVERPKMGFGVPLDLWLRTSLKDWAEALLDESRLRREGFFNPSLVRKKWDEHLSGRRNWQYHLWDVLMFQAWLEAQSV